MTRPEISGILALATACRLVSIFSGVAVATLEPAAGKETAVVLDFISVTHFECGAHSAFI